MTRLFIIGAIRNLLRHKVQTLINICSLAFGLTVSGFAFLYVKQELSYDRGWPDGARVHRLVVDQRGIPGAIDQMHSAARPLTWELITEYFASYIDAAARTAQSAMSPADADSFTAVKFVDPQFLDIFQFDVVEGDLRRTLSGPGFIAMEEATATRLGMADGVGQRVTFKGFNDGRVEYELAAIYRAPQPISSATTVPMFTLLHEFSRPLFAPADGAYVPPPWEASTQVWLKLKPDVETASFNALQPAFIEENITTFNDALGAGRKITDHLSYRWQPVSEIRFNPITQEANQSGDPARVTTFAIVGLLVLLVGCSNSVSLSLAAALERRREIGVRKAAGALPHEIMRHQLGEAVVRALLALLPALVALELLAPAVEALLPFVRVDPGWSDHATLAAIAVVVGLACGAYPALVLSATRPQAVVRVGAQQGMKSGLRMRTVLVAAQFGFASMLLVGTAALYVQLAVARVQPLGFDPNNIAMVFQNDEGGSMEALSVELKKLPGIVGVVPGANLPPNINMPPNVGAMTLSHGVTDTDEMSAQSLFASLDFIDFMGMRIIAGRSFDAVLDSANVQVRPFGDGGEEQAQRVVINASAARALGFTPQEAVDRFIYQSALDNQTGAVARRPFHVIGVMEDNLYMSLRRRPGPMIYMGTGSFSNVLMVRFDDSIEDSLEQLIHDTAQRLHGIPPGSIGFVEPVITGAFLQEQNESKLLLICGGLAIVLASFGLYGLAAFALERQVKEVGVRKAMGASVGTIVGLYLWRFSRPIVVANLLAWPVASYFVLQWIERFPYQMDRAWLAPLCVGTLAAVLLIAMLTVSVITTRAAMANPVRSLRYE